MTAIVLEKLEYAVLNAVTLKKMTSAPAVARVCGFQTSQVDAVLSNLAGHGLVALVDGAALPGDAAEPTLEAAAVRFYAAVRADAAIASLVDRFEGTNAQFLTAMSSWQQIDVGGRKVANDHSDSAYDDKVISRLDRLIQALHPLLDALTHHDGRFAAYRRRFETAMEAIDRGEHRFVSSPTEDSVHNIWFEFHEDLLRTLGRKRAV